MVITKEMVIDTINLANFISESGLEGEVVFNNPGNQKKFQAVLKPKMEEFKKKWGNSSNVILNNFLKEYRENRLTDEFTSRGLGFYGLRIKAECWACIYYKNIPNLRQKEIAVAKSPHLWVSIFNSSLIFGFAYGFNIGEDEEIIKNTKNNDKALQNIFSCLENDRDLKVYPHDDIFSGAVSVSTAQELKKYWSKNITILKIISKENLPENIEEKITETFDKLLEVFSPPSVQYWQISLDSDITRWEVWKQKDIISTGYKESVQSVGERILDKSDDEIKTLFQEKYPENQNSEKEINNLIQFLHKMKEGDYALVDHQGSVLGWGIIKSDPKYDAYQEFGIYRQIEWKNTAIIEPVTDDNEE